MITRLEVSNYKSLGENVVLELGSLTALVGPNGSGKSNIADVFRFVADALRGGLASAVAKRGGFPNLRRGPKTSGDLRLNITGIKPNISLSDHSGGPFCFGFVIDGDGGDGFVVRREMGQCHSEATHRSVQHIENSNEIDICEFYNTKATYESKEGRWIDCPADLRPELTTAGFALPLLAADQRFQPLMSILSGLAVYSIFPNTLREPQRPNLATPMDEHGANWCSFMRTLARASRSSDLVAALGRITGDIDDVRVQHVGGYLVTEFRHGEWTDRHGKSRGHWLEAAQESDGTLRMAGILSALLQEPPLTLIGIEEPELSIHPGALPVLYDFLREASTRGQVLITTHSPDLLSLLKADEIRVVERRGGMTTVARMEEIQRDAIRSRLVTPGDVMRMEGLRQEIPAGAGTVEE